MEEKIETLKLLLRAIGVVVATSYRIYSDTVNAMGQPWSMMIHSTVWGLVGGLIVKLFWHDAVIAI